MQNNKSRNCLQLLFIFMVAAFVLTSCTKEDLSECPASYNLTIKAFDTDNADITNTDAVKEVSLYLFDASKNYLAIQSAPIGKTVELNHPEHEQLYVVAWGNSMGGNQMMPTFKVGDKLETAFVSLNKTKASLPTVQSPDDLFYGAVELTKESQNIEKELPIRRRTSSVMITAHKLKEFASASDNDFSYILRKSTDKLDFYGKPNGTDVSYRPAAAFDHTGQFKSPIFNILSTSTPIEIDIYHGSVLIATVIGDSKGNPFKAVEGKLLNILIDFSLEVSVTVTITDWGKQEIWKEF